jgi:eukaryotic-like serine/threonine-protein kinase
MSLSSQQRCSNCGSLLIADWNQPACPLCLLKLGLSDCPENEVRDEAPWFELPNDLPRSGEVIGHYRLLDEIARGGMGIVYRAQQEGSQRIVALKMILPHQQSTPEVLARFRAEREIVANLDHPNILPIYEIGEADGIPYFTMKLAENGSLIDYARKLRGRVRDIARFMSKVAAAVHYAHQRGVLHRDLKPANILLDQNFEPLVCDFGLARRLADNQGITVSRAVLGTPHYLSPEQARGEGIRLTTSSDIFSLGTILYELLVWYPPFVGTDPIAVMRQVAEANPAKPSSVRFDIPRDLEVICLQCLEKDPQHRYPSALALANDLDRWLEGRSILARPASPPEQLWRWAKRNPILACACALLIFTLIGIAVGSTLFSISLDAARKRAETAELGAKTELRSAYLSQARATRLTGLSGQRFMALDAIARAAKIQPGLDLRNEAAAALALTDLRVEHEWRAKNTGIDALAFNPTLEWYAVAEKPGVVSLRRVSDQTEIRRIEYDGTPVIYLTPFSQDSRFIGLRHANDRWTFWDVSKEQPHLALELVDDRSGALGRIFTFDCDIAPHKPEVAVTLPNGNFGIYNLLTGSKENEFVVPERPAAIAYNEAGDEIAISEPNRKAVAVYDVSTSGIKLVLPCSAQIMAIAWSPSGDELVCGDIDGILTFWNPSTGVENGAVATANDKVMQLAYTRDGNFLVSNSFDRVIRIWDARQHLLLCRMPGWGSLPGMQLTDSGKIGCTSPELDACILEASLHPAWQVLHRPKKTEGAGLFSGVDFNRDASLLVTAALDGVRLYDVRHGRLVANLQIDPGTNKSINEKSAGFVSSGQEEILLISSRKSGLSEWPSQRTSENSIRIGPPHQLDTEAGFLMMDQDGSTRHIVLANNESGRLKILDRDSPGHVLEVSERPGIFDAVISPDGNWLASTIVGVHGNKDTSAQIWNLLTGQLEKRIQAGIGAMAVFSPGNEWLVMSGEICRALSVPAWENGPQISSDAAILAFSHSGKMLAASEGIRTKIYAFPEMRELVTLENPYGFDAVLGRLAFSPDDSRLCVLSNDGSLYLWDLFGLREELRRVGLDWDIPAPNASNEQESPSSKPLEVTVVESVTK